MNRTFLVLAKRCLLTTLVIIQSFGLRLFATPPVPVRVTTAPVAASVCAGGNASFTIVATGALTYQWSVIVGSTVTAITNGGVYSNATTATLNITGAIPDMTTYRYRCTATGDPAAGAGAAVTTNPVALTVNVAPTITTEVTAQTACIGGNASFSAVITGSTTRTWQVSTNGTTFTNVANGALYTGQGTTSLTITGATALMSGYTYRLNASGPCTPSVVSGPVALTVVASTTYYQDGDGDGYGNAAVTTTSCTGTPVGYAANSTDCDDTNANAFPGQVAWTGAVNTLWSNTANWSCGSLPTATSDVIINSAANMPVVDITSAVCNNLIIGTGASLSVNSGMVLDIKGTSNNSGSFSATGKTTFSGVNQTLPAGSFAAVEIAGSGLKKLSGATTISGILTLTASRLSLDNYHLTIAGTGSITGGTASSYIVINGSGMLKQQDIGSGGRTGAVRYPVGSSSSYTPLLVTNAGTSDEFAVAVINNIYDTYNSGDAPTGTAQISNNVNKTWTVSESVPGGSNVTLTFQWNQADELGGFNRNTCFPAHYLGTQWSRAAARSATGSNPYLTTMSGITSFSPFGIGSGNTVLPLTLTAFTGKESTDGVALQWTTAREVNTAGFDIERSANQGNFIAIGSVIAKTTGIYNYSDKSTSSGVSYAYRLKMRDKDGQYTYSASITVTNAAKKASGYLIYPNPVTGSYLFVQVPAGNPTAIIVAVLDVSGKTWYEHPLSAVNMSNGRFEIPVKQLPGGAYLLRISDKNGEPVQVQKFTLGN